MLARLVGVLLAVSVLAACTDGPTSATGRRASAPPIKSGAAHQSAQPTSSEGAPAVVHGTVIRRIYPTQLRRGRIIPSAAVVERTASFGSLVYGLANTGQPHTGPIDGSYPVISTDGAHSWKIDGPKLHIDAAQGASFVSHIKAVSPRTVVIWGGWVIVTHNGGTTWVGARPGQIIYRVISRHRALIVETTSGQYAQRHPLRWEIWQYQSRDGGLTWHYAGTRPPISPSELSAAL